jgi:hypothetical protein
MPTTSSNESARLALPFVGRAKEAEQLRRLHAQRKHVLILGQGGVGKSALIGHLASLLPLVVCPQSAHLSDICGALESQLGLDAAGQRLIQRKNRILQAVSVAAKTVVFDGVGWATPKVSSLLGCVSERVPVWIVTRSGHPWDLGHVWPRLGRFAQLELRPFHLAEARALVEAAVSAGLIPVAALEAVERLHHLSAGVPRVLCELLHGLASGDYDPRRPNDLKLLDLDRRIHQLPGGTPSRAP